MSRKTVEFFYDVVSPYSWFAFETLMRYQNRWNITLKLRPFFLGGIMHGSGNKPPAMVPLKSKYMFDDVQRLGKYFNVPIRFPKNPAELMLTKGTLATQRFLTAIDMTHPGKLETVSRELWMRAWHRDEDITEPASFAEAARQAGISEKDIAAILPRMKDEDVKDRLKNTTQDALDLGAFGAPIILAVVDGRKEWVFGSDRFPIFADLIGKINVIL
uniref:Glutathione S-transferase kappa n=2 Tax=Arion vulgaris TaxID=1028688 RepID=A0A0B7AA84_9EUPU